MDVELRLNDLGFIVKGSLKKGRNRVATQYKPHHKNGTVFISDKTCSYFAFDNSVEPGYFWLDDKYSKLPMSELNQIRKKELAEFQKQLELERIENVAKINKDWNALQNGKVSEHWYLTKKRSHISPLLRIAKNGNLLIPVLNINKELTGFQIITNNGKLFQPGSSLTGNFIPLVKPNKKLRDCKLIILCEGYSTGSSLYQATGDDVAIIVCFAAFNVHPVSLVMSLNKELTAKVVACYDNDNVGKNVNVNGFVINDDFIGADANDFHITYGIEMLKEKLNKLLI